MPSAINSAGSDPLADLVVVHRGDCLAALLARKGSRYLDISLSTA
jgi:hypothetical protein